MMQTSVAGRVWLWSLLVGYVTFLRDSAKLNSLLRPVNAKIVECLNAIARSFGFVVDL